MQAEAHAAAKTWTKPYYGLTHLCTGKWRVSVTDHGSFAELHCWFPGCAFSPTETRHQDVVAAKEAGEKWLAANAANGSAA